MTATQTDTLLSEISKTGTERALKAYRTMVTSRLTDQKMAKLVRQNKGGTFFLAAEGHEMVGGVCSLFLRPGSDYACCYYRDQPLAIGLGCCLTELFGTCMARLTRSHSRGRMMPYHYSSQELRMPSQSSAVATQFLQAAGIAHSIHIEGGNEVVYVSGGDGSTSEGDFHEALNFAGLHKLPVIFVIQDNGWAISVPVHEQIAGGDAAGLVKNRPGVESFVVDGCDYEQLSEAMEGATTRARTGKGPSVIVAKVPRMGAHSGADDPKKYKDESQLEEDKKRCPIKIMRHYLLGLGISEDDLDQLESSIHQEVERCAHEAMNIPFPKSEDAEKYVFKPWAQPEEKLGEVGESTVMVDAINKALAEEMKADKSVVVFGEDVAHGKGGVFGATRGLTDQFGVERCFNTPLAEATIVGLACGMAMTGKFKPVAEIQFADYLWPGFDQLVSEVSSAHFRSGGEWEVPAVFRIPCGGYIQGGVYHSQSIEGFLTHCPGLKVVMPSNAADAKGLMKTAIRDPNPVVFLEHKALYRQTKFCARPEPDSDYAIPFGKAKVVREGQDLTVACWGMTVVMAAQVAQKLEAEGIDVEVIDLRTLVPFDAKTVTESVKKTGKLLIAHEAPRNCGFGAEIAAQISEQAFEYLDGPVHRVCGLDTPVAYSKPLENAILPQLEDIEHGIRNAVQF